MKKILISLIVLSFIFTLGCAGNTQPKSVTEPNEPEESPQTKIFEIGQAVQFGDYRLTVMDFNGAVKSDNEYLQPKENNKFVGVEVLIENTGKEPKSFNELDFTIQDKNAYTYQSTYSIMEPSLGSGDLQPGRKVRGCITFEIPENDSGLELIYQPDWLDTGQVIVKLTD